MYAPQGVTGESSRVVGGRSVSVRIGPARAFFSGRASNGDARPDNRLALLDQAFFAGHRAAGQNEVMQCVWVYEHAVDFDGLRRFHHNLGYGLLGRRIERSPLPFGRCRWVSDPGPSDIDIAECARPRAELSDWADERSQLPTDAEWGPSWHLGVLPVTDGSTAVSLVASHYVVDGLGFAVAVADAVLGNTRDLGYPPPRSRPRLRAVVQDARQTARDAPQATRALVEAAKLARRGWLIIPDHQHRDPSPSLEATAMTLSSCRVSRFTSAWRIGMPVRTLLAARVARWSPGWLPNSRSVWGADTAVTAPSPCNSL